MNSAERIRRTRMLNEKYKNDYLGRVAEYDRKKIKITWNFGSDKLVVIHSNGGIFSTCVPGI